MTRNFAFAVLAAYATRQNIFGAEWLHGVENLALLVPYGFRLEGNRRLHGDEADQLHDVVRHHVAQSARRVVIASSQFNAYSFTDGNLYVIE